MSIKEIGLGRYLLLSALEILGIVSFGLLFLCLVIFDEMVPSYADTPVERKILGSLRVSIWTAIVATVATCWLFILFKRRRERGLKL